MAKRDDTGKTASKNATELIRSSAAEYLTFVAATGSAAWRRCTRMKASG